MFRAPDPGEGRGSADASAQPGAPPPGFDLRLIAGLLDAAEAAGVDENALVSAVAEAIAEIVASRRAELAALRSEDGGLHPLSGRNVVERDGHASRLTWTEWQLFSLLWSHPGVTLTRNEISEGIWGSTAIDRSAEIEMYVSRLRRKVERDPRRPDLIVTVRGVGYRLDRPRTALSL